MIGLGVLFVLLMVGGESVLLPVLRLSLEHGTYLSAVMVLAVVASVASDLLWYSLGRCGARMPILARSRPVRRVMARRWMEPRLFETHWKKLLLLSKFVYGTRTSAQLVCGATRRRIGSYLAVNTLGTTLLVVYLHGLVVLFARGFSPFGFWWNVGSSVLATVMFSFFVGRGVRRVLHPRTCV